MSRKFELFNKVLYHIFYAVLQIASFLASSDIYHDKKLPGHSLFAEKNNVKRGCVR